MKARASRIRRVPVRLYGPARRLPWTLHARSGKWWPVGMSLGNYERKQLHSPSRIVRWSHGSRFTLAMELVAELRPRRLLDYGCGDGTFLRLAAPLVEEAVGADQNKHQVKLSAERHADEPKIRIVDTAGLGPSEEGRYDAVFCMEVLEHCIPDEADKALRDLARLVAPGGAIVISVPIEIGPVLLGKQVMRRLLGRARVGDYEYTATYTPLELARMLFAGATTAIDRPMGEGNPPLYPHKGFNWRALERRLGDDFVIESRRFSPLPWSRGLASSQVWFICRKA